MMMMQMTNVSKDSSDLFFDKPTTDLSKLSASISILICELCAEYFFRNLNLFNKDYRKNDDM